MMETAAAAATTFPLAWYFLGYFLSFNNGIHFIHCTRHGLRPLQCGGENEAAGGSCGRDKNHYNKRMGEEEKEGISGGEGKDGGTEDIS